MDVPEGYLKDSRGRLVPEELVSEVDLIRDALVKQIVANAETQHEALCAFKRDTMDEVATFMELSAEKYGARLGGEKGNVTLMSYDGLFKVTRSVAEQVQFDERLQVAKTIIDECLNRWSEDSGPEVRALIQDAFEVDKSGRLNTQRILSLRKVTINDPRWKMAMEAISDSLSVVGSKSYIRVHRRCEDGSWQQIPLDLSSA